MQRALTIKQPWADAIFMYGKDVENRSWNTNYRGRIWVHAAKHAHDAEQIKAAIAADAAPREMTHVLCASTERPTQRIIGSVELYDVVIDSVSAWAQSGKFHFLFRDQLALESVLPARGYNRLWFFTPPATI